MCPTRPRRQGVRSAPNRFYCFPSRSASSVAPLTIDAIMARATRVVDKGFDLRFRALAFRHLCLFSAFVATLLLASPRGVPACITIYVNKKKGMQPRQHKMRREH